MTNLERIKEIENTSYDCEVHDIEFLLKAFRVMREIAMEANEESADHIYGELYFEAIDQEFEERMSGK